MRMDGPPAGNLTGSLLVAHPTLRDPHFRRTVLFLSHHTAEDGAVGYVLNRPLRKTLSDITKKPPEKALQEIGLFYGGPVQNDQITIASLQWRENPSSVAFQSYTGTDNEVMVEPEWQAGLRVFVGYAGWSKGQLEAEIAQNAWLIFQPNRHLIEMDNHEDVWRSLMHNSGPLLKLLAEAPDDPELN